MKVYMFPGQGSQAKGMGGDLFDGFKELTDRADDILGYSVKELCLQDPKNELGNTKFTQPAIYVVNALSYFRKVEESGRAPDFIAGHSLGEFDALMAAGCFDFETGLTLVRERGELMGQASGGAMAAVLNAGKDEIEEALKAHGLTDVYLANYNTPSQIVLSGRAEDIAKAEKLFKGGKKRYYPLATSGAFHSVFMRDAMERFTEYLKGFKFADQKVPVIANVTARPYENAKLLETLSRQITSTVRWCESIQYLLAAGISRGVAAEFEEAGHGEVLTRLFHTIKAQSPENVLQPYLDELSRSEPVNEHKKVLKPNTAEEKVVAWNKQYPVGTKVKSLLADYASLETRTEAIVLFGHRAAVYMKGYNGYFDLDELTPA